MNDFDSLGARQQPPREPEPIASDVFGNPIFEGEHCYLTEEGYVKEDDIMEYVEQHFPKIILGGI
jgi:hypothetical protein